MKFPGYEVESELGRGGMGVVYRARDAKGLPVAIKALLPGVADQEGLARFQREQTLQGALGEADGFVPLLAAGVAGTTPFLVMPLLARGTLRARIERGRLGVDETLALGGALASAVARAHARGIVHRDLKPENVIFADDGRPLVADLGLARIEGPREESLTGSFSSFGTVGYAAPEQLDDARSATPASDVFALGVILYECLAGATPYPAESLIRYVERLRGGRFMPLARVRRDVPLPLAAAIERALSPDPRARPADALAFGRALAAATKSRRSRRRLIATSAALLAALLVAGALGLALVLGWRPGGRPTAAVPPPPPTPAAAPSKPSWPIAQAALAQLNASRWAEAHALVTFSFACEPPSAIAYLVRARVVYAVAHDPEGARADLEAALALDPGLAPALGYRALAALETGDDATAERDIARALAIDAGCTAALLANVHLHEKRGEKEAALAASDALVALAPRSLEPLYDHWRLVAAAGRVDDALRDARRMSELWPNDLNAIAALAETTLQVGLNAEARDQLTKLVEAKPEVAGFWAGRARASFGLGDIERSHEDALESVKRDPSDASVWTLIGLTSSLLGDEQTSVAAFNRSLELDPREPATYLARARCAVVGGDARTALADCERALALEPGSVEGLAWRATASQILGDRAAAKRDADEAIRRTTPRDRQRTANVVRALIREEEGDIEGAIADYEQVIEGSTEEHSKNDARFRMEALKARRK